MWVQHGEDVGCGQDVVQLVHVGHRVETLQEIKEDKENCMGQKTTFLYTFVEVQPFDCGHQIGNRVFLYR